MTLCSVDIVIASDEDNMKNGFTYLVCKRCYSSGSLIKVSGNKVRCLYCGATYYLDDNGSLRDSCTKHLGCIGRSIEAFM